MDYAAQSHGACGLHEDFALVQTYFPAENHQGGGNNRHEPQPAYLDENENHDLPEARPFEKRIVTQSAVTVKGQKTDISVNLEPIQKVFLCLLLHLHL